MYPDGSLDKRKKANFRRVCKPFSTVDNKVYYNKQWKRGDPLKLQVLWNEQEGFGETHKS